VDELAKELKGLDFDAIAEREGDAEKAEDEAAEATSTDDEVEDDASL
jgi:hypothetical protein